jgi:GTP cyclohydrolase IA
LALERTSTQVPVAGGGEGDLMNPEYSANLLRDFLCREGPPLSSEIRTNTPRRFVQAFRELMGRNDEEWTFTVFESECDEMILVRDITFVTLCEHHLLPFMGSACVGYIPQGRIAGLSKIARSVRTLARGIWAQENLTIEIADFLESHLKPRGVAVVLEAEHTCMAIRGVKADGAKTTTSAMRGAFREEGNNARAEFLGLIR